MCQFISSYQESRKKFIKILAELGRTSLKVNIEILVFKYLIKKGRYVFKACQEKNLAIDRQVKYMKIKLELFRLGNLMGNIYKKVS